MNTLPHIGLCPQCQGQRVTVNVLSYGGYLLLQQPRRIGGLFGARNTSSIDAVTCLQCGYTALYAKEPDKLVPNKE